MENRLALSRKMLCPQSWLPRTLAFLFLIGGVAPIQRDAFASSAATGGSTHPQVKEGPYSWNDPDRETCGFGCLYQKANENLGFQIKYMAHKLDSLASLDSDDERAKVLGSFCMNGESHADCYNRYVKFQIFALKKIHAAIKKNYDSATMVSNEKGSKELLRPYAQAEESGKPPKKPQSPYIVTFEDLQNEYNKMRMLGSNGYQKWVDQFPFEPSADEFVKFVEKPKDPDNPAAGSFMVLERDEHGKLKIDEKAYKAALKKYHDNMDQELKRMGQVKPVRGGPTQSKKAASADLKIETGSLNAQAFEDARVIRIESSIPKNGKTAIESQKGITFESKKPDSGSKSNSPFGGNSNETPSWVSNKGANGAANGGQVKTLDSTNRKPAEKVVKVITPEELKKDGVEFLYYSPDNWGKVVNDLEARYLPSPAASGSPQGPTSQQNPNANQSPGSP